MTQTDFTDAIVEYLSDPYGAEGEYGPIGDWDVSGVTDMSYVFQYANLDDDVPIGKWDMSSVTDMSYMFRNSQFNGDLSEWDVSSVTTMVSMFESSTFNSDISDWDVSSVTDMSDMFWGSDFDKSLNWCVDDSVATSDFAYDTACEATKCEVESCGKSSTSTEAPTIEIAHFRPDLDCEHDSTDWHKTDEPSKDCSWVAQLPHTRCIAKGEMPSVTTGAVYADYACPVACDTCHGDSKSWYKNGSPDKDCAWVAFYPEARCDVKGPDGVLASTACEGSCLALLHPTSEPTLTFAPTSTFAPSKSPTITIAHFRPELDCTQDSQTWHKVGYPSRGCSWVAQNQGSRCSTKGEMPEVTTGIIFADYACSIACDTCHGDSSSWYKNGSPDKDCAWVAFFPEARCDAKGPDGVLANTACQGSCSSII